MKIYTKAGDSGWTALSDGTRVAKHDLRLQACGDLDELNALIGWSRCAASSPVTDYLQKIQQELFAIGAEVAAPDAAADNTALLPADAIQRLEAWIDQAWNPLPALKNFILPAGTELSCRLHIARTCCRRAERALVALAASVKIRPALLAYTNRLSDWLFAQARLANHQAAVPDLPWPDR